MDISSKHGVITHCATTTSTDDNALRADLEKLDGRLVGMRYDAIEVDSRSGVTQEVVDWVRESL